MRARLPKKARLSRRERLSSQTDTQHLGQAARQPFGQMLSLGLLSGLAATWMMTRFQTKAYEWVESSKRSQKEEKGTEQPDESSSSATVQMANRISQKVLNHPVSKKHENLAGQMVHYGFGTTLGGIYGSSAALIPKVRSGWGTAYGSMVFLIADEITISALKLAPPPHKVPLKLHAIGFFSHLVYGLCLESCFRILNLFAGTFQKQSKGKAKGQYRVTPIERAA